MHASEQQIVVIKSEQQNLIEIPDFLSTTEGCPLLGAFTKLAESALRPPLLAPAPEGSMAKEPAI